MSLRVVGQTDVLGSVVAEAVGAAGNTVIDKLEEIILEGRTLGIDVGQAAHLRCSTLKSVVPIVYVLVVVLVEKRFKAAAASLYEVIGDLVKLRCSVVRDNVHQNLYTVLVGFLTHLRKFFARAELVVADFEIGRLIVVVPLAVAVQLHAAVLSLKTCIDRRGLHRCKTCSSDVSH